MATLEGFIDEVIAELRTISGLNFVPDDPTNQAATFPFVPVFHSDGIAQNSPFGTVTYLDTVTIGLLYKGDDLARANQIILGKKETVIEALFNKRNNNASPFTDIETFGDISYTYGPIEWGGIPAFGFLVVISDVKIQNNL